MIRIILAICLLFSFTEALPHCTFTSASGTIYNNYDMAVNATIIETSLDQCFAQIQLTNTSFATTFNCMGVACIVSDRIPIFILPSRSNLTLCSINCIQFNTTAAATLAPPTSAPTNSTDHHSGFVQYIPTAWYYAILVVAFLM